VYRYCLIRLAKAPEFFLPFLHARILYVYSGLLKEKFYFSNFRPYIYYDAIVDAKDGG